jgi:hypothetical protein
LKVAWRRWLFTTTATRNSFFTPAALEEYTSTGALYRCVQLDSNNTAGARKSKRERLVFTAWMFGWWI